MVDIREMRIDDIDEVVALIETHDDDDSDNRLRCQTMMDDCDEDDE